MSFPSVAALACAAVVVLDPGHGGDEPGAVGPGGVEEKTIVLELARSVRERLVDRGVRVAVTRAGDSNPSLADRLALAHRLDADAFVSLHLNASPVRSRRGVETYVASVLSTEADTMALVEREEPGEVRRGDESRDPLARLLEDLDLQAAHRRSATLASSIQDALGRVEGLAPNRGLRQAPFFVLREARVPAVLVEVGYVTHGIQAAYLASSKGRREVADQLTEGILRFLGAR